MRNSSEVSWIRAKNNVGMRTVTTDWHAIIPGVGSMSIPPGTVCDTLLTGALQSVQHSAIDSLDGRQHGQCRKIVETWLADLPTSPGLLKPPEEEVTYAAPGSSSETP